MSAGAGLEAALRAATELLEREGVRYAVVGALAVSARTIPRFTSDVDLAVAVESDEEVEALVGCFIRSGYSIRELFEHSTTGDILTVRLVHPSRPDVSTDLLVGPSGIEDEVVAGAERVEVFPLWPVPVATTGHLIAMKLLAHDGGRPVDRQDLIHLLRRATPQDLATAETAASRIQARGRAPGRDLTAELEELRRGATDGDA